MSIPGKTANIAHAFNRFGLGGSLTDTIPTDPMAWLTAQLQAPDPLSHAAPGVNAGLYLENAVLNSKASTAAGVAARAALNKSFLTESKNFIANAMTTQMPFRERLVWFWSNHFGILAGVSGCKATVGAFVREAIRPHVTGTYTDMLLAVMQHPAMLISLNNDVSIGPNSTAAKQPGNRGFNENLARETLELYTVGLAANFTQADVDALAFILTGWSVSYNTSTAGFVIISDAHEPGPQTLLGVTYPGTVFDGYAALTFLATQQSTYRLLANRLVTHFVSDTPTQADVDAVTLALTQSGGNLAAAATAVIGLANAWIPQTKLRTPIDFIVAAARAAGIHTSNATQFVSDLQVFTQPLWQPAFPNGWPDTAGSWAAPAQMMRRVNWASAVCNTLSTSDPVAVTDAALGPLLSPSAAAVLARLSSTHDKLTVLFCSPDFQRR